MRRKVMDQHVSPFQRPDYLQQTLDDHNVEVGAAAGDYQLLFKKYGSDGSGNGLVGEG